MLVNEKFTSFNGGIEAQNVWNIESLDMVPHSFSMHIKMSVFFNASHQVEYKPGQFGEMHRHSYQLTATAVYQNSSDGNYYVPFEDFRNILKQIARHYEGRCLNDIPLFKHLPSTTENFVQLIAVQLEQLTLHLPLVISEISLNESPTIGVTLVAEHGK